MKTGKRLFVIITMGLLMNSFQSVAQTWKPLGNGVPHKIEASCVNANDLYVVYYNNVAKTKQIQVAKWNDTNWTFLPTISFDSSFRIFTICVYKKELYLGGNFDTIFGIYGCKNIVRYNGSNWKQLDQGVDNPYNISWVSDLQVYKNKLYISGRFYKVGKNLNFANNIASWDSLKWDTLGAGVFSDGGNSGAYDLYIFKDTLIIGGPLGISGGKRIYATWDGSKLRNVITTYRTFASIYEYNNQLLGYVIDKKNPPPDTSSIIGEFY